MADVEIKAVPYGDPLAQRMVAGALADLSVRYGDPGDGTPVDPADFAPPAGAFLVALIDGEPVGCVAWRSHGATENGATEDGATEDGAAADGTTAELKRLYTVPEVRGEGVARRLLAAVEAAARSAGRRRMILECGYRQPEAIALYESSGYERIEDFGHYRHYEGVRSYGKDL